MFRYTKSWVMPAARNAIGSRSTSSNLLTLSMAAIIAASCFSEVGWQRASAAEPWSIQKLDPVFAKEAVVKRMEAAAKRFAYAEDIETFADTEYARRYYMEYLPAKITQKSAISEISELMTPVRKRLDRAARTKAAGHVQMMRWLYIGMKPIAEGNYRPAARINAILLISRMDMKAADRMAKTGPVPVSVIPDVLLPIYLDESAPDGVRVIALKGVRRYVKFAGHKLEPAKRDALAREMNRLLQGDAPTDRDPVAHAYVQRFAIDILTHLPTASQKNFSEHLVAISVDAKKHEIIAVHSAARIADLKDVSMGKLAAHHVLAAWSRRAAQVVDQEILRLKALTRPKAARVQPPAPETVVDLRRDSVPSPRNLPQMGGDPDQGADYDDQMDTQEDVNARELFGLMPPVRTRRAKFDVTKVQPPEVVVSRRKLNHTLQQLHAGASGSYEMTTPERPTGLLKVADETAKPAILDWLSSIHEVSSAINGATLRDRALYLEALKKQSAAIKKAADKLSVPEVSRPPLA